MSLWDEVKTNLIDLYSVTSDKTVEVARVSSRKYEKFGISRDIERQFSELGNLVYSHMQEGKETRLRDDEKVVTLVERIAVLEKELKLKDEEIDSIRNEASSPHKNAAAAGSDDDIAAGTAESSEESSVESPVETVITDPILEAGRAESAILMDAVPEEATVHDAEIKEVTEDQGDDGYPKNNPQNEG